MSGTSFSSSLAFNPDLHSCGSLLTCLPGWPLMGMIRDAFPGFCGGYSWTSNHRIGDLTITATGPVVFRDGGEIYLSTREFALLQLLVLNHGKVVSRAEILAHLYAGQAVAHANLVEVLVMRLRRKLSPHGEPDLVRTCRGMGYRIQADVHAAGR